MFQEVPKYAEPKPTTVTVQINPLEAWPNCLRVALLHLAEENAMFGDYTTFEEFKRQMETLRPFEQMASDWPDQLDKHGDPWKIVAYCTAGPKAVVDEPPYSSCPRCGTFLWGKPSGLNKPLLLDQYNHDPTPVFCMKCGQRFKYDGPELAYAAVANSKKWSERIKRELGATQPKLATVD
ncbi:hypothetical protein OZX57_06400 [Bifidobacterium sp. ESL0682]|uniref:hypothetical protein n=1 Tax=Bifidobacterium sp. ESL0682 TaxID=2983212 RepID=UPI0023F7BDF4|nr:hypothetical protein [Bifidobacterium sp. ESL0682]WEV41616.1 hypothetical protein OZX57_06400 [Bifidobacterium sp. ESL0682]